MPLDAVSPLFMLAVIVQIGKSDLRLPASMANAPTLFTAIAGVLRPRKS